MAEKDNQNNGNTDVTNESQGQILWVTEFTEASAIAFHEAVMAAYEGDPNKPLVIHINSYGGEVDALFSMLDTMDTIRSVGNPNFKFLTVCKGKAQSAGAVLLSYGDYRFATPTSRIMIHQVFSGTIGGHAENEVEFAETSRMNTQLLQIIRKQCRSKLGLTEFRQLLVHNHYQTPTQAKEFGIIDVIGYPKVVEKKSYEIVVLNAEKPAKTTGGKKNANRRAN